MDSNAEFIFELRQIEESAHPIAAALQDGKPTAYARRVALLVLPDLHWDASRNERDGILRIVDLD
jgi:hypothetical protein